MDIITLIVVPILTSLILGIPGWMLWRANSQQHAAGMALNTKNAEKLDALSTDAKKIRAVVHRVDSKLAKHLHEHAQWDKTDQ